MNALREQQEGFASSIINGVDGIYAQTIRDNELGGARRLGIYQHGVSIGFCDALGGVYEVTRKLVGDDFFTQAAENYSTAHPSRSGNVHDFGALFPEFLRAFPGLESLPYITDVARLEWIYHTVFHSPVGEILNIEKLAQVPESCYEALILQLSPACHLFYADYPVLRIWQTNQDDYEGDQTVSLDEGGVRLAVVREGKQIAFHQLDAATFSMLDAISKGQKFDQICGELLHHNPGINIGTVLQNAVINRFISSFFVNKTL